MNLKSQKILNTSTINLEIAGASVLLSVCRPWLLTKRPTSQTLKTLRRPIILIHVHQQVHICRVHIKSGSCKGSSGFIILSMDFNKTFVDLNTFGVDMTFERHSWVSNKAYTLNSVATSPATEANVQQDFIKILLHICLSSGLSIHSL